MSRKYTLTFDNYKDLTTAVHGSDFVLIIWKLDQWLREKIKYGHNFKNPTEALEATRTALYDMMNEYGIYLENFIE